MLPSQDAIALAETSEGLRLQAYRDVGGKLTIGCGHTDGVQEGDTITADQAKTLLQADLAEAAAAVSALVKVPLTQGQFDALCDFVFNLGEHNLERSTLLRLLNAGNYQAAANQFRVWVMAAGAVQPGLVTRRAAERALFVKPAGVTA